MEIIWLEIWRKKSNHSNHVRNALNKKKSYETEITFSLHYPISNIFSHRNPSLPVFILCSFIRLIWYFVLNYINLGLLLENTCLRWRHYLGNKDQNKIKQHHMVIQTTQISHKLDIDWELNERITHQNGVRNYWPCIPK
jgi:hypothetical protein